MPISPKAEELRQRLETGELGDRLVAVNEVRDLPPEEGFELLQVAIADDNARVRYSAVSQFDTVGASDLGKTEELLRDCLLNDAEMDVKAAAADCLGALQITDAFEDLIKTYEGTSEWLLKLSIVAALGVLGDRRCFETLEKAMESETELERLAAISAMGDLGDDRAIAVLLPLVTDEDWQVRYRLAQALKPFAANDEVKAAIATLAEDPVEQVSAEAKV
ncbi:MAG: HEAT repeat domain-containing protein [Cyanobacteria bacterium P01_D01_bin.73]